MKSSAIALVAGAALASATQTYTEWKTEVVTVTVTAEPSDFVQATQPAPTTTATPTPEPETTSEAPAPSPPPPPPAAAAAAVEEPETTEAPVPTTTPEPVVQTPEPEPEPETTTETQQPSQTSQPETESVSASSSYSKTAVDFHNAYRKDHSAGGLQWDDELAQWAANTANGCVFAHDMNQGDGKYGQNLASYGATGDLGDKTDSIAKAIKAQWYAEVSNYNFFGSNPPAGSNFGAYGHFTQLVWKDTQKVGCATVKCPAGTVLSYPSYYHVCNYSPPGNFNGKYNTNVLPSLGLKIDVSV